MKRILLALLCLLVLTLFGCAAVNQTNSFVELRSAATAEAAVTPEATELPEATNPPVVELNVQPTATPLNTPAPTPDATNTPMPAETPTPTAEPENGPGGFNG